MMEYSHTILVRDRYQIVALSQEQEFDSAEVTGYAVVTPTGARIRYEVTLEDARLWVDRLIEEEELQRSEPRASIKPIRRQR